MPVQESLTGGYVMARVPADVTAMQRAQWLAELSDALHEAQELLSRLPPTRVWSADALDLSARIEAAQAQVRMLRLGRRTEAAEPSQEWSNLFLWQRAIGSCT